MRPVNLIPADQRRGVSAPTRTGPIAYIVVAALAIVLAAVAAVTLLGNQTSDRKAEVASLEARSAETQARAQSLTQFTSFQEVHDARVQTVQSLATSRFDWERVLQELSRVLPAHIWLTDLTGTVAPDVGSSGGSTLRGEVSGPALELLGCGRSQNDVARLVAAMEDIDGITRVIVTDSGKTDTVGGGGGSCQTRPSIPTFSLIAAFDGVTVPATTTPPLPTAPADPTAPAATDPSGAPVDPAAAPTTDPGTPSAGQQRRIDTAKGIVGAGG